MFEYKGAIKMCKKVLCVCTPIVLCILLIFTSCLSRNDTDEFWGSYTYKKTYSYDHKLYAVQTVEDSMIVVTVYKTDSNEEVGNFIPARAFDFWGICWERDSYNIWTQSADIGDYCYKYVDGKWICDGMIPPDYIISKYDERYINNPELRSNMYLSQTE